MSHKTRLVDVTVKLVVGLCTDGEWPEETEFKRWVAQNTLERLQHHDWGNEGDVTAFVDLYLDSYQIVDEDEGDQMPDYSEVTEG